MRPLIPLILIACTADPSPAPGGHTAPPTDTDARDDTDAQPADTETPTPAPNDTDPPADTDAVADTDTADTDTADTDIADTDALTFDPSDPCGSGQLTPVTNPVDISPAHWDWSPVSLGALFTTQTAVVRTDADYATFQTTYNLELPTVNFATREVVAAWHTASSTCGISLESWAAYEVSGTGRVRLDAVFHDSSANCEEACDAEGGAIVVVSVPRRTGVPFVCRGVVGGCEDE